MGLVGVALDRYVAVSLEGPVHAAVVLVPLIRTRLNYTWCEWGQIPFDVYL